MELTPDSFDLFTGEAQDLGHSFLDDERLEVFSSNPCQIQTVVDSESVFLLRQHDGVTGWCSCNDLDERCAHLWATSIVAMENGWTEIDIASDSPRRSSTSWKRAVQRLSTVDKPRARSALARTPAGTSRTALCPRHGLLWRVGVQHTHAQTLRQAACHPGLLDTERMGQGSAKLAVLMSQLQSLRAGGHKALVFSQFTRFLGLIKARLEKLDIPHEYLDGKTRDREARIDRFQGDPACSVFLISLKAGGSGLNLTAADYVFLLDPWWNPAVESQAIGRSHRIGQRRPVFAYRLITRDTVEEKILELQGLKSELVDSVITENKGFLGGLSREELRMLFE